MDRFPSAGRRRRRWFTRFRYVAAAVVVLAIVFGTVSAAGNHEKAHRPIKPSHVHAKATTFLGSDGVEASWVIAENKLPGTDSWKIPPGVAPNTIEGFANLNYVAVGGTVTLYVSTASPTFTVTAYRMGWYGGLGARRIWVSNQVPGVVQPTCPLTPEINMVSCDNWTPSLSMPVTPAFVQGDYLLKLVGTDGQQGYIPLTVWDPTSTAAYLIINRTFTEEGWNSYGGYSFYQGEGPCPVGSNAYPVCNRAESSHSTVRTIRDMERQTS